MRARAAGLLPNCVARGLLPGAPPCLRHWPLPETGGPGSGSRRRLPFAFLLCSRNLKPFYSMHKEGLINEHTVFVPMTHGMTPPDFYGPILKAFTPNEVRRPCRHSPGLACSAVPLRSAAWPPGLRACAPRTAREGACAKLPRPPAVQVESMASLSSREHMHTGRPRCFEQLVVWNHNMQSHGGPMLEAMQFVSPHARALLCSACSALPAASCALPDPSRLLCTAACLPF